MAKFTFTIERINPPKAEWLVCACDSQQSLDRWLGELTKVKLH